MNELQVALDILPLGHFKTHASALLKGIHQSNRPLVITQHGKPTAVLLSPTEFDRLNEQARFNLAVSQGLADEPEGRLVDDEDLCINPNLYRSNKS